MAPPSNQGTPNQRLAKQLSDLLKRNAEDTWLSGVGKAEVRVTRNKMLGMSDALVFKAQIKTSLFVKLDLTEAKEEKRGYELLLSSGSDMARHLVPPLFSTDDPVWILPYMNAPTFHDLVIAGEESTEEFLLALHQDFLSANKDLWTRSRAAGKRNLQPDYWERANKRRKELLKGLGLKPSRFEALSIVVNGTDHGTIKDLFAGFGEKLRTCCDVTTCVCHRDEHPKNLLVVPDSSHPRPSDWAIIDYGGVLAESDWLFAIAKIVHWWDFFCAVERARNDEKLQGDLKADCKVSGNQLLLTYDEAKLQELRPRSAGKLVSQTMDFAARTAKEFGDSSWDRRLYPALFASLFGVAGLYVGPAKFAVPILLGRAVEFLTESRVVG